MWGKGRDKWFISATAVTLMGIILALVTINSGYGQAPLQLYVLRGEVLVLTTDQIIKEGEGITLSMLDQIRVRKNSEAVIGCGEVRLVPVAIRIDVKTLCRGVDTKPDRGILPDWVWKLVRSAYSGYETSTTLAGTKGRITHNKTLHIIAPAANTNVLTDRPWFAWAPAGDYQITVLQGAQLVWSTDTHGSAKLTYPDGYDPLPSKGETQYTQSSQYTWEITGLDGKAFASTNFYVLAPAAASRIRQQLNEMSRNLEQAGIRGKNKDLALAGFLQRERLQAEALKLLENALSKEPGDPELKLALQYVTGLQQ